MSCFRIDMRRLAVFLLLGFLILPQQVQAQETITEVRRLDFGLFSLHDNDAQYTIAVDANDDSFVADPTFFIGTPPHRGEYLLEGFTPGTEITVNVDDSGLTLDGAGGTEVFATINYTVAPAIITADGAGEATIYVGGTLRTRGDTTIYDSGSYEGDIDITFSW